MDPHVRWLRRRLARTVATLVAIWLVVAATVAFVVLAAATDAALRSLIPWAILIGQVVVLVGLGRAALSNPLNVSYLAAQQDEASRFVLADESVPVAVAEQLAGNKMSPLLSVREQNGAQTAFDLFQSPKRTVTMARNRTTEAVSLFSRLSDGRILFTDTYLPIPHSSLVLNKADQADVDTLIDVHGEAIDAFKSRGISVVTDDGWVFVEALSLEHRALLAIGGALAPFLNLGGRNMPLRFAMALPTEAVCGLALAVPANGEVAVGSR